MEKNLENDLVEINHRKHSSWPDLSHESHQIFVPKPLTNDDDSTKSVKTQRVPSEQLLDHQTVLEIPQQTSSSAPQNFNPAPPKKAGANYILQGMCVMSLCCLGLWFWIFTYEPLTFFNSQKIQITTASEQTLLEISPAIEQQANPEHEENKLRQVKLAQANRFIGQGKTALKYRNANVALLSFEKAEQTLKNTPGAPLKNNSKDLNTLKANALYLKGFEERQKENYCKAKAFLKRARQLSPSDQKIINALQEISFLSSC